MSRGDRKALDREIQHPSHPHFHLPFMKAHLPTIHTLTGLPSPSHHPHTHPFIVQSPQSLNLLCEHVPALGAQRWLSQVPAHPTGAGDRGCQRVQGLRAFQEMQTTDTIGVKENRGRDGEGGRERKRGRGRARVEYHSPELCRDREVRESIYRRRHQV